MSYSSSAANQQTSTICWPSDLQAQMPHNTPCQLGHTSSCLKLSLWRAGRLLVSRLAMPRLSAYSSLIRWWAATSGELSIRSWNLRGMLLSQLGRGMVWESQSAQVWSVNVMWQKLKNISNGFLWTSHMQSRLQENIFFWVRYFAKNWKTNANATPMEISWNH